MSNHPQDALPRKPDAQWVNLWLDGRLSAEQERQLLQAIEQDTQLAQLAQQWKQLRRQLQLLPRCRLDEEFTQGVLQQIENLANRSASASRRQEKEADAPLPVSPGEKKRPTCGKQAPRMPREFWVCVGTGALAASLLLFWAWGSRGPEDPLAMKRPGIQERAAVSPEKAGGEKVPEGGFQEAANLHELGKAPPAALLDGSVPSEKVGASSPAPGQPALSQGNSVQRQGVLARSADSRMKGASVDGASPKKENTDTFSAPGTSQSQIIPWHRLPGQLRLTLSRSQRAGRDSSAQVVVLQLGVAPDVLQQGWLDSQLAALRRASRSEKSRRAGAPPVALAQKAVAAESFAVAPQENKAKFRKETRQEVSAFGKAENAKPVAGVRVVRVQVSPEQLTRLVNQLAQFQSPRGPVQYLRMGQLVTHATERQLGLNKRPKSDDHRSSPTPKARSRTFQAQVSESRLSSQRLVLRPLPHAEELTRAGDRQAAAVPARPPATFAATDRNPAGLKQPVAQLWLVLEVHPAVLSQSKLPLVAPMPGGGSGSR